MRELDFLERHLKSRLAQLVGQAALSWRLSDRAAGADFELRIGQNAFLGEVVLSRSSVHFNEKVQRMKAMVRGKHLLPLLAAPSLSPERQELLRHEEICFVDLAGNAWIKASGLLIDQRSREKKAYGFREVNSPFSDKSSLVLRIMMDDPERYWGNNEIAEKASVSPGWVSQISHRLEELRYVVRAESRKLKLFRPQDVLQDWVEFYRQRKQEQYRFRCSADSVENVMKALKDSKVLAECKGLLSSQAGASLVAPHARFQEVHVYSNGLPASITDWKQELRLEEAAASECNLVLVNPYYHVSGRYGSQMAEGFPVVSDVQLYLDLRLYPLRGEEQARHLFEKRLAPKWHLEEIGG